MKRLFKSRTNKKVAGVCGGIAEYFGIDATIIRLIWAILIFVAGTGLLAYIIAAIVMQDEPDGYTCNTYKDGFKEGYEEACRDLREKAEKNSQEQ